MRFAPRLLLFASSALTLPACGPSPAMEGAALRARPDVRRAAAPTAAPMSTWVRRLGGALRDECDGVHVDAAGSVFVAGSFTGVGDFGREPLTSTGRRDAFVVKIDPGGNPVWSRGLGSVGDDAATSVATDAAGNVFIAGWASGALDRSAGPAAATPRIFVMAAGPGGEPRWTRVLPGGAEHVRPALAVDASGAVVLAAQYAGDFPLGPVTLKSAGKDDVVVMKLAPDGSVIWARSAGGAGHDGASAIAVDPSGRVLVAGESEGPIDFGGGPIGSGAQHQGFVVALDGATGTALWGRSIADRGRGGASGVTVDAAGQITVVGAALDPSTSVMRTFVAQLDPAGRERWGSSLGDAGITQGSAAAEDAAGNVIVTGSVDVDGRRGDREVFLARFDPGGRRTGMTRFGAGPGGSARGRTVAFDRAGQMVIGGSFSGRLPIAGSAIESAGESDVFVARLPPSGGW